MKELYFLLLFIVGAVAVPEYHGDRRFWTVVDSNGRTKVALHVLNEPVNLIFPNDKTTAQHLSDIKLLSPAGQDTTNTLKFTLLFDDRNHIRGEIKAIMVNGAYKVTMYLYQNSGVTELPDDCATEIIEGNELALETIGSVCFKDADHFHQYGTDTLNNAMELQVSPGAFGCQAFLILPDYIRVEDAPSPKAEVNPLNSTFAEKGDYRCRASYCGRGGGRGRGRGGRSGGYGSPGDTLDRNSRDGYSSQDLGAPNRGRGERRADGCGGRRCGGRGGRRAGERGGRRAGGRGGRREGGRGGRRSDGRGGYEAPGGYPGADDSTTTSFSEAEPQLFSIPELEQLPSVPSSFSSFY
uniref:Uncharacterized protein n=1 Tax=Panagrolaimus sp. PS1159 TaxID=55785 RepID=A0AC35GTI0_9BILA